jgi:hypothetical protein
MKLPYPLLAILAILALTACTDKRTQKERDVDHARATIIGRLGKGQPYGENLWIVDTRRSKVEPSVICGYWDKVESKDRRAYTPFAIDAVNGMSVILGLGDSWGSLDNSESSELG